MVSVVDLSKDLLKQNKISYRIKILAQAVIDLSEVLLNNYAYMNESLKPEDEAGMQLLDDNWHTLEKWAIDKELSVRDLTQALVDTISKKASLGQIDLTSDTAQIEIRGEMVYLNNFLIADFSGLKSENFRLMEENRILREKNDALLSELTAFKQPSKKVEPFNPAEVLRQVKTPSIYEVYGGNYR